MRFSTHVGKGDLQNSNSKFVYRSEGGRKIIRRKIKWNTGTLEEDFECEMVFCGRNSKLSFIAVRNWA